MKIKYVLLFLFLPFLIEAQQYARAVSDWIDGVWTDDGGGTTDIYQAIDEVSASDTDYIKAGSNGTAQITVSDLTDPEVTTGHVMRFRMKSVGAGSPERCEMVLEQTSPTFKTIAATGTQTSRGSFTLFEYTLTAAETDRIDDYASLRFWFTSSNLGGGEEMQVSWAEFEVPDAPSGETWVPKIIIGD